ncbi:MULTISPECIES: hypothetical protein [Clostridium]|uniref:Uncharacterized protein n=1 Tax=Clostridium senegalense TaxID=1465809 RepID=A0A6M0H1L7_9CLOT|nr:MULTISPECIES: hypothetical protein [Clostridium]NEU04489.1 hypothetical protein [Clostridium senegalense]
MGLYRYNKNIISVKNGYVTGKSEGDLVLLMGCPFEEDSNYYESVDVVIQQKRMSEETMHLNIKGCDLDLDLINVTESDKQEIMIRGVLGGEVAHLIAYVYKYEDGTLTEIFNYNSFYEKYEFQARYLDNYNIEIFCEETKKKFVLNISDSNDEYLNLIYSRNGKALGNNAPYISAINAIYPVKQVGKNYNSLLIQQIMIEPSNEHMLGIIETLLDIDEYGKMKVIYQSIMKTGKTYNSLRESKIYLNIEDIIPEGSEIISLNKFGGKNDIIKLDLDNDKEDEIIYAYNYKGYGHIGVCKSTQDGLEVVDDYEGKGDDIGYLNIKEVCSRKNKNIIVGWKIRNFTCRLDLLEYKDKKISSLIPDTILCFNKIDVVNLETKKEKLNEIVLWYKKKKTGYEISMYKWIKGNLIEINKYNKYYYTKVLKYYDELIKTKNNSIEYLYNVAKAKYLVSQYEDALKTINKAMYLKLTYPSIEELRDFQYVLSEGLKEK